MFLRNKTEQFYDSILLYYVHFSLHIKITKEICSLVNRKSRIHKERSILKYKGISFYLIWNTFVNAVITRQRIRQITRSIWSQRNTKQRWLNPLFANIVRKSSNLNSLCIIISSIPVKRTRTKT